MADWFNFALYALQQLVSTLFQLDTGLGFTLGDVEIALLVIGLVASAFIVHIGGSVFTTQNIKLPHKDQTSSSTDIVIYK